MKGGDGFASFGQSAHPIQSLFEVLSDVRSGVGGADNRPQFSVGLPAHEGTEICERVDQNGLALGFQFLDGDGLPEIRCGHGLPSKQTPAEKNSHRQHGGRDLVAVPPDEFHGGGDGIGRLGHHRSIAQIVFDVFFKRFGRSVAIDRSLFQRFQDNAIQITTELPTQSGVGSGGRTPTSV